MTLSLKGAAFLALLAAACGVPDRPPSDPPPGSCAPPAPTGPVELGASRVGPALPEVVLDGAMVTVASGEGWLLGGWSWVTNLSSVYTLAPGAGAVGAGPPLARGVSEPAAVSLPLLGWVLVSGGDANGVGGTATTQLYRPEDGAFREVSPLPQARIAHAIAALADCGVVVVGGRCETGPCNDAWRLDLATGRWQEITAPLPQRRSAALVAATDGMLYLIGGMLPDDTVIDLVERYVPDEDRWEPRAPLSVPRARVAAVALPDGTILVLGGSLQGPPTTSSERYDPTADRWQPGPDMSTPRLGHAAAIVGEAIWIAGGTAGGADHLATSELLELR